MLNSSISRYIVRSYAVQTQISTHVLDYVKIPKYNPENENHIKLAQLSKTAHELAIIGKIEEYAEKVFLIN